MSRPSQTDAFRRVLDERRERTTRYFLDLCRRTSLPELLGRDRSWAIIGGAIRDMLLADGEAAVANDEQSGGLGGLWPDLDIAVSDDVFQLPVVTRAPKNRRIEMSRNSFGGVKIREKTLGTIDLWRWDVLYSEHSIDGWLEKLDTVDFGLNAVCFVWPQAQVVIHPRWIHDLEARTIEKLYADSPRREVQVVRAIALGMKIQFLLGERVTLGSEIRDDLRWLVSDATRAQVLEALRYLLEKTRTTRWPQSTFQKFIASAARYPPSSQFKEAVIAAAAKRLDAALTSERKDARGGPEPEKPRRSSNRGRARSSRGRSR